MTLHQKLYGNVELNSNLQSTTSEIKESPCNPHEAKEQRTFKLKQGLVLNNPLTVEVLHC